MMVMMMVCDVGKAFSFLDIYFCFLFDLEVRRARRKGRFMQEEMRGHLGRKFIEEELQHQSSLQERAQKKNAFSLVEKVIA